MYNRETGMSPEKAAPVDSMNFQKQDDRQVKSRVILAIVGNQKGIPWGK